MSALFLSLFEKYKNWKTKDYMSLLYENAQACQLEPTLRQAFIVSLPKQGFTKEETNKLIYAIENSGTLQTSHHTALTHGPTFSCIDALSLCSLPEDQTYIIAANSGVAFSNPAWSGAFCFEKTDFSYLLEANSTSYKKQIRSQEERENHGDNEKRLSFLQGKERDKLVYGSAITAEHVTVWQDLLLTVKNIVPSPVEGNLFSLWATKTAASLQSLIFKKPVFIFDINLVITEYLLLALQDKNHFLYSLFFNVALQKELATILGLAPFTFLTNQIYKKKNRITTAIWNGSYLHQEKTGTTADKVIQKEELLALLQKTQLCPGLFLTFFILNFYNPLTCFGSFLQLEYIAKFKNALKQTSIASQLYLENQLFLTTGKLPITESYTYPLDMALNNKTFDIETFCQLTIKDIWTPIKNKLQL